MLCRKAYVSGRGLVHGCGQCLPCRINRRRTWTHRLLLEGLCHEKASFVTLTYEEERDSLAPEEVQRWLKRLRKVVHPEKIRYFLCGEYGELSERPHYHAALFNYPACVYGSSQFRNERCCTPCNVIRDTWGAGHVIVGTLTRESAQYISGYVTKKMTGKDDERLRGRQPEFARMSLRPGIGAEATWEIASVQMEFADDATDVVGGLRHGTKVWPLGGYLQKLVRERSGRLKQCPPEKLMEIEAQMLDVRLDAEAVTREPGMRQFKRLAIREAVARKYQGRYNQVVARHKLYGGKNETV